MNPGATMRPRASNLSSAAPRVLFGSATSITLPSRRSMSMGASIFCAGSMRWPPLISRLFPLRWVLIVIDISPRFSCRSGEDGHADGDAVLDFFADYGLLGVG